MANSFIKPFSGGEKSYSDLLYERVREIGVYTYWKQYCRNNDFYFFNIGEFYK